MKTDGMGRRIVLLTLLAIGLAAGPAAAAGPDNPGVGRLQASIAGRALPGQAHQRIVVDQVLDQPDVATIVLGSPGGSRFAGPVRLNDDLTVDVERGVGIQQIFTGEVVSIEPSFQVGGESRVTIRALNRLHRLTREQKARTFLDRTDAQIVEAIAAEHGLAADLAGDVSTRYDVVYQHNQTDLEFLLVRAARIGYEVFVEDTTLFFHPREVRVLLVAARRRAGGDVRLRIFHPRLASTETVQQIVVRAVDPASGRELVGRAAAPTISLEPQGGDPNLVLGRTVEFVVDGANSSQEEIDAIAKAKLSEVLLSFVTGEASLRGDPRLRAEGLVEILGAGGRFDGRYFIVGASHRFSHDGDCTAGYRTVLRVEREDGGLFFLPGINDEVLVAFEHGDLSRPVIVGSLWDSNTDRCSRHRPPRP